MIAVPLWACRPAPAPSPSAEDELPSIVVLPMVNMSEDPDESDHLADGITQAVITKLTQAGLRVTPWDTARRYRLATSDLPADSIARELNVEAALTGTFQLSGDEILVNLSLIDAETGFQTWADIIVAPYRDVFQVQLRIATGAARSLKRELTGEEERSLTVPLSENVDAYELYLQGAHVLQEDTEESVGVAHQYFTRAIAIEPGLSDAYLGLGAVYDLRYFNGWEGGLANLRLAEASYREAVRLNPASSRARRGLISVAWEQGHSEECLMQAKEAMRFSAAGDTETLLLRGVAYHICGLPERAVPLFEQVIQLDPKNQAAQWHLPIVNAWTYRFDQSIASGESYLRQFGDDAEVHTWMGVAYHFLGDEKRAWQHYAQAADWDAGPESVIGFRAANLRALLFAGLLFEKAGERERAEEIWRRGLERLEPNLERYPDQIKLRLFLACFRGLLGDDEGLRREERRAFSMTELNPVELRIVAAVYAKRGDLDRAAELMLRMVRGGRLYPAWRLTFDIASLSTDAPALAPFLREHQALESRLAAAY